VPLTGGFFSKDAILGAVWLKGGALYAGLYILALFTAFITALYTTRMLLIVFEGEEIPLNPPLSKGEVKSLPRVMEWPLLPLALLGILGGLLNLPEYLGGGGAAELLPVVSRQSGAAAVPFKRTAVAGGGRGRCPGRAGSRVATLRWFAPPAPAGSGGAAGQWPHRIPAGGVACGQAV